MWIKVIGELSIIQYTYHKMTYFVAVNSRAINSQLGNIYYCRIFTIFKQMPSFRLCDI